MMSDSLFDAFEPVSAKQWKQKIQMDLRGADYNETLIWQSLEGIHVRPFYHREDTPETITIPGQPENWKVVQQVFIDDASISNRLIMEAIQKGAEAISLMAQRKFDIEAVFNDFPFDTTPLYFQLGFLDLEFQKGLISFLQSKNATVHYRLDPIHHLATVGNWFHSMEKDHRALETLASTYPNASLLGVDLGLYQNAGANKVQELAYGLAHVNEYLNHLDTNGQLPKPLSITFTVALGSNYFFEIAKIRALRLLYASLASAYGLNEDCHILAMPSKRNKTLYDYNVNMLRTTTESMSAVLGGANAVCNLPYDVLYHKSNDFGERISRNQLLILKAESYFDAVSNPADGSYYIETITQELAQKALELFKNMEQGGGFLKQLKEGLLQKKIKESAQREQHYFDEGTLVLVGTNKYPNPLDVMNDQLELYPFLKTRPRKTLIAPILEKRLSETLEKERLKHEKK